MEARTGIEPVYTDLQSAASPLRHRAFIGKTSSEPSGSLLKEAGSKLTSRSKSFAGRSYTCVETVGQGSFHMKVKLF